MMPVPLRHLAAIHGLRRGALVCSMLLLSGCAALREQPPAAPEIEVPAPAPVLVPEQPVERRSAPPAMQPTEPEPQPEAEPLQPSPGSVAVVLSDRTPAYENVAIELGHRLDDFLLYNLADKSLPVEAVFSGIADSNAKAVIAIGRRATEQALLHSAVPIVFCQVFNIDLAESAVPVKGISSIPPLSLQIEAWKRIDPGLTEIGAILGKGHDSLIAEAERAAAANGVNFHYRIAASDRETLYMFNRMAPAIDGFWLFPDNRVLSIPSLKAMLTYGSLHHLQIAVFNSALLDMGAAMSATTVDSDIAATAVDLATRIIRGEAESIPAMTLLHEVDIHTRRPVNTSTPAAGSP